VLGYGGCCAGSKAGGVRGMGSDGRENGTTYEDDIVEFMTAV
jgi:hypothetical protein